MLMLDQRVAKQRTIANRRNFGVNGSLLANTKAQVIAAINVWQKLLHLSSELPSENAPKPSILDFAIDASTA
jgi:hypothetical protein